jgi:hypothetical protein
VVGYDAAGALVKTGRQAKLFRPGDEAFYAGSVGRPGADMEFHLLGEQIVGKKPNSLDFAAGAALALTSTTAWEAIFDRPDVASASRPETVEWVKDMGTHSRRRSQRTVWEAPLSFLRRRRGLFPDLAELIAPQGAWPSSTAKRRIFSSSGRRACPFAMS